MGQKFFDIHESSRFNMSFKCSGEFNIIYIMRTIMAEGEKQPPSVKRRKQSNDIENYLSRFAIGIKDEY